MSPDKMPPAQNVTVAFRKDVLKRTCTSCLCYVAKWALSISKPCQSLRNKISTDAYSATRTNGNIIEPTR